jgi:branched-chain amino acid transport system ATP-binding protein
MTDAPILQIENLAAGYGPARVIEGLNLTIRRGELVLLAGRNGAGKSTVLKTLAGLLPAQGGTVQFNGKALIGPGRHPPSHRIIQQGIGYVPEERRVFASLTVEENLQAGRKQGPGPVWLLSDIHELFPALRPLAGRQAGALSGGEQQMLTIARTLMGAPSLLLLDEPSEGLAPIVVQALSTALKQMAASGLTILMAEQNWRFAAALVERILVLDQGRLAHDGPIAAFAADKGLQLRLLGAG